MWPQYGYVPLNRVWFTISPLSDLNSVSFWTGSLSKRAKTCGERPTFVKPIIFFLNICFHDFILNSVCKTKQIRVRK